jgi:hypothetical protein
MRNASPGATSAATASLNSLRETGASEKEQICCLLLSFGFGFAVLNLFDAVLILVFSSGTSVGRVSPGAASSASVKSVVAAKPQRQLIVGEVADEEEDDKVRRDVHRKTDRRKR